MSVTVGLAGARDAEQIADIAAVTFPLACPPGSTRESIETFIEEVLSPDRFHEYLADPARTVLTARKEDSIIGYAMLIHGAPTDPKIEQVLSHVPTLEVSKMYVMPDHHGGDVSAALISGAVTTASQMGCSGLWLGVNQENTRARRFYTKHGFVIVGTKTFTLGNEVHDDFVMERALDLS